MKDTNMTRTDRAGSQQTAVSLLLEQTSCVMLVSRNVLHVVSALRSLFLKKTEPGTEKPRLLDLQSTSDFVCVTLQVYSVIRSAIQV